MKFFIICTLVCLHTLHSRCLTSGKPLVANDLTAAEAEDGTEPSEKIMPLAHAKNLETEHSNIEKEISQDNRNLELADENELPLSAVPDPSHAVSDLDQGLDGWSQESNKEPPYEIKDLNSVIDLDADQYGRNADLFGQHADQSEQNADQFPQYADLFGQYTDQFAQYIDPRADTSEV